MMFFGPSAEDNARAVFEEVTFLCRFLGYSLSLLMSSLSSSSFCSCCSIVR